MRRITELLAYGLNLAGIEAVLALEGKNDGLRAEVGIQGLAGTGSAPEPRGRLAFVGHLGHYSCPNCGAERPRPDVAATAIELHGMKGSRSIVRTPPASSS